MMAEQSRDDDYSAAGFGGSLAFGSRPALLIVDVVMAYLAKDSPLYAGVEAELAANERLLAAARAARIPVIFTNVVYEPGGFSGGMFYRKVPALKAFERGSPLGAFPDTLQPLPSEIVVSKQYPSAFFGTPLAGMLVAAGIDTLLITGYSTSGCVRATALDALCHGFAPFVVKEASGDRDAHVQQANLFDIQAKIGEVIGCADALAHLTAIQSQHEETR
ncbi:isochorismatase family protein [Blastomonas sp.]|uniref:isochorismatase family protein n=1 Tax=Blastomonas sp. TaxID=1909299 RepID=UPI00391AD14C